MGLSAMIQYAQPESIEDSNSTMNEPVSRINACDICDATARVTVLARYSKGAPQKHHYCIDCADKPRALKVKSPARDGSSIGTLLVCIGGLCAMLATFGDKVPGFEGLHPGYGRTQGLGIILGVLSVVLGAILRVDMLAICGTALTALTACADFIVVKRTPGVGWKQVVLIIACLCLVLFGRAIRAAARSASGRLMSNRETPTVSDA